MRSLAGKLLNIVEKPVDIDANGRPDRLDVTARVNIFEPGEYEIEFQLRGDKGSLEKSAFVKLERGTQQTSISFSAAELYDKLESDGPYHLEIPVFKFRNHSQQPSNVDVSSAVGRLTAPYRRQDWDRGDFHGTTNITGQGIDVADNGKFRLYRVRWEVVTPGGLCSWSAELIDSRYTHIGSTRGSAQLTPGPATFDFDFDGRVISQHDRPDDLKFSATFVTCEGRSMPTTHGQFKTGILRPEDFEPIPPDFQLTQDYPKTKEIGLRRDGIPCYLVLRVDPIGQPSGGVILELSGVPSEVKATIVDGGDLRGSASHIIRFFARDSARPGDYPVRVIARGAGKEHEISLRLVVEPPTPANIPALAFSEGPLSVVLVVGTDSLLGEDGCTVMKEIVRRFPDRLQPGRDALTIIRYGVPVQVSMPLTQQFEQTSRNITEELAGVPCQGNTNTVYALEKAREQLRPDGGSKRRRIVVLLFSAQPSAITANWPIRTQADSRRVMQPATVEERNKDIPIVPSACADTQGRHYPDLGWATGDSMPDVKGALIIAWPNLPISIPPVGHLLPPDSPAVEDVSVHTAARCGSTTPFPQFDISRDIAYLPETDIAGTALDVNVPSSPWLRFALFYRFLERFESGPYKGKIRPDLWRNRRMAAFNLLENELERLRNDGIEVIRVSVGENNPLPREISIHDTEQVTSALERVWTAMGRTRKP